MLLGMSGGVDSSTAAILLKKQGFEVIGITFIFSGTDDGNHHFLHEAKYLANEIKIKHLIVDLRNEFKEQIIDYFKSEYLSGRTPFPCAYCNPNLKFKYLEEYANELNCRFIATGHYVRIGLYQGKKYLFRAADSDKDQTFFLWGLKREIVDRLVFPLGEMHKTHVRNLALENGFSNLAEKKDSLGICFIEGNDYRTFLKNQDIISKPGNFVDHNNRILGRHKGITNYTVGQRRGLGINTNIPLFVSEIRLEGNQIVLGKYEELYRTKLQLRAYHFIDNEVYRQSRPLVVRIRYRLQETPCNLNILDDTRAEVNLLKPEAMISPGQTAVFYDGDRLVGGGFIESAS